MVDQDLLEQLQFTVIEPPDGGASWPSGLWTRDEVLGYINERQDRLVRETHMIVAIADISVVAPYGVRHATPADWMATVRLTWESATVTKREVCRSDSWEADHGIAAWPSVSGTPKLYMDGEATPLVIQIAPIPNTDGTLEISYVPSCTPIDGNGTDLTVANEFVPTVKYGVLSDMFSKVGRANDPVRSEYCSQRYQMGIEIAQTLLKGLK